MDRIALITGGNRGIGLATARGLAKLDHFVLIGSRDEAKGERVAADLRAEGFRAEPLRLNMDDAVSHANAAATIEERFGRLDVLVNNAAVIHDRALPPSEVSVDAIRHTFETNFTMLVALTQRMLPLLRRSEAGRIVNLSSSRASLKINADPNLPMGEPVSMAYSASKAAVNMFTVMLALELRKTKIKVNAADPGWVRTEMGGEGAKLEVDEGAVTSIRLATLPEEGPTGGFFNVERTVPW